MVYQGSKEAYWHLIAPYLMTPLFGDAPTKKHRHLITNINDDKVKEWTYIEPFAGGLNMLKRIDTRMTRIACDINQFVIAMFKYAQLGLKIPEKEETTIEKYNHYKKLFHDTYQKYDYSKNVNRADPDDYIFVDLAMCGYYGYLLGQFGKMFCGYEQVLKKQSAKYVTLQQDFTMIDDIKFMCIDAFKLFEIFAHSKSLVPEKTIIYCDPPYRATCGYITTGNMDFDLLYQYLLRLGNMGFHIFVSEYFMPDDDFLCIWNMKNHKTNSIFLRQQTDEELSLKREKLFIPRTCKIASTFKAEKLI
jgi:DNA adenine methylase